MITIKTKKINTLNQNTYDSFINSLDFNRLSCSCGHSGCLTKHAYYTRSIKADSDALVAISVLRVKCSHCGRTHAIVPCLIVPYSQISVIDQLNIINTHLSGKSMNSIMNEKCLIDENCIRRTIVRFKKFFKERLTAFSISLNQDITKLIESCFKHFSCQFMQIKCICNKYLSFTHIT
jgi:hypothetical protein